VWCVCACHVPVCVREWAHDRTGSHERKVSPIGNDNGLENYTCTHNHMEVAENFVFFIFAKLKLLPLFFRILFLLSPLNVRPARKTHTHKRVLIAIGCEWLACVCVYVVAENIVQFFFRWLNSVLIEVVVAAWFIAGRNFSAVLSSHDRLSFDFAFSLTWLEI